MADPVSSVSAGGGGGGGEGGGAASLPEIWSPPAHQARQAATGAGWRRSSRRRGLFARKPEAERDAGACSAGVGCRNSVSVCLPWIDQREREMRVRE